MSSICPESKVHILEKDSRFNKDKKQQVLGRIILRLRTHEPMEEKKKDKVIGSI